MGHKAKQNQSRGLSWETENEQQWKSSNCNSV